MSNIKVSKTIIGQFTFSFVIIDHQNTEEITDPTNIIIVNALAEK